MVSVHIYSVDTEQYNKHIEISLFSWYSYDLVIITCEHLKWFINHLLVASYVPKLTLMEEIPFKTNYHSLNN